MKTIKDIIVSISEPPISNVAWLKPATNGTFQLLFFGEQGWLPVSARSEGADIELQFIQEIPDITIETYR